MNLPGGAASPLDLLGRRALPITGADGGLEQLYRRAADADTVLLGEATHGTHEFYVMRAAITRRLITQHGFNAVAVEADWPDAYRVNRFVRGENDDRDPTAALGDFARFPRWMWRNTPVRDFIDWLRDHNRHTAPTERVGFYGLDLYSLYRSADAVVAYLDEVDAHAANEARQRYACLGDVGDPDRYGLRVWRGVQRSCENEVIAQLRDLQRHAADYLARDGLLAADRPFHAEQNARLVRTAEEYYRAQFGSPVITWNLRDRHMSDTLTALTKHLAQTTLRPRIVVWEHNSHVGNAAATELGARGETNLGELTRQRLGPRALLVGFTTYQGSVSAASQWGGSVACKQLRPALPESFESWFHQARLDRAALLFGVDDLNPVLRTPRLQRAVGVIYRPETERMSHYFSARLPEQFDALIHLDETTAVEPLDEVETWRAAQAALVENPF